MKQKAIFIHHSTGANLIKEGRVRQLLEAKNSSIEFWDHGYSYGPFLNRTYSFFYPYIAGLSDAEGKQTGIDYQIKITNTDPQGYEDLFKEKVTDPPVNAFSNIIDHFDIIIFKSCFPVTKIESDGQLKRYKKNYLEIRTVIDRFPKKQFILFTPPPLRMEMTRSVFAKRAREFSRWMKSKEYLGSRKNIVVFDFFAALADDDASSQRYNTLRSDYCRFFSFDSHPNAKANRDVGILLVDFLINTIQ